MPVGHVAYALESVEGAAAFKARWPNAGCPSLSHLSGAGRGSSGRLGSAPRRGISISPATETETAAESPKVGRNSQNFCLAAPNSNTVEGGQSSSEFRSIGDNRLDSAHTHERMKDRAWTSPY